MGVMICRWTNSDDDGIYWLGDATPPIEAYTLFDVMERYLTTGETLEILSYDPGNRATAYRQPLTMDALNNEREAHGETHHAY
jgi:hypothetical protein